jgi:sulfur carrier protein ThiS
VSESPEVPATGRAIRIEVTLKGSLATWLPGGRGPLEVPEGTTVDDMLTILGIPELHCIYVVNGSAVTHGAHLRDDDRVQILPPMAGG